MELAGIYIKIRIFRHRSKMEVGGINGVVGNPFKMTPTNNWRWPEKMEVAGKNGGGRNIYKDLSFFFILRFEFENVPTQQPRGIFLANSAPRGISVN